MLREDKSKFVDTQRIQLEDFSEDEEWEQALEVNLEDDLVGQVSRLDKVIVTGILRTYQEKRKNVKFDFCLDCNSLEHKETKREGILPGRSIREIIRELEKEYGEEVPLEEVFDLAKRNGIERERAEEIIETMKRDGILYSPMSGIVKFVGL